MHFLKGCKIASSMQLVEVDVISIGIRDIYMMS